MIQKNILMLLIILLASCKVYAFGSDETDKPKSQNRVDLPIFQSILNNANLKGSILIYETKNQTYYSNDFEWSNTAKLPASTYKIPNSIIAFETNTVLDETSLFKWNGESRRFKTWERDLTLTEAFHFSCVPCYQAVAAKIGPTRMNEYVNKLNYGNMDIQADNIETFWLEGDSSISQFQQIDFLRRFYHASLPISERTHSIMKNMMTIEDNDEYSLSGKTGWSISEGINNAWFVGYVETKNNVVFFASNIEPNIHFDMDNFARARKQITYNALKELGILKK